MTDYKASQFNQTIASKSTIVPSDHQLEYNAGDTIKFDVPAFMGFIDPRQSYLQLTEGVEPSSSAYNFEEAQLFNSYGSTFPFNTPLNSTQDPLSVPGQPLLVCENEIEVCLPLSSGVLGGNKIFPSALTQGLKVEIDTNQAMKALEVWDLAGLGVNNNIAVGSANGVYSKHHFGIKDAVGGSGAGVALTRVDLFFDTTYKSNTTTGYNGQGSAPWKLAQLRAGGLPTLEQINAETANVNNVRAGMSGASNLIVGQHLFGTTTDANVRNLGKITQISFPSIGGDIRVSLDGSYAPGAGVGDVVALLGVGAIVGNSAPGIVWCGGNGVGGAYVNY